MKRACEHMGPKQTELDPQPMCCGQSYFSWGTEKTGRVCTRLTTSHLPETRECAPTRRQAIQEILMSVTEKDLALAYPIPSLDTPVQTNLEQEHLQGD